MENKGLKYRWVNIFQCKILGENFEHIQVCRVKIVVLNCPEVVVDFENGW